MTDSSSAYSQPAYSSGQPTGEKKTLSIISMIAGILGVVSGFFGFGLLFAIAAVVLGHLGQRRERVAGKPFWLTGLITGYLGIAINAIVLIIAIAAFAAVANNPALYN